MSKARFMMAYIPIGPRNTLSLSRSIYLSSSEEKSCEYNFLCVINGIRRSTSQHILRLLSIRVGCIFVESVVITFKTVRCYTYNANSFAMEVSPSFLIMSLGIEKTHISWLSSRIKTKYFIPAGFFFILGIWELYEARPLIRVAQQNRCPPTSYNRHIEWVISGACKRA